MRRAWWAGGLVLSAVLFVGAVWAPAGAAGREASPAQGEHPRLIVLISVDQLRGDLLLRYDSLFTGGLRRLMDRSAYFTAAAHDHAETETGPGHATLGTGVWPSHSGMVSNDFFIQRAGGWRRVYVVQDLRTKIVGYPQLAGRSPRYLLRDGLADWLKRAQPRAKLVSVSGKDRSAILMMGKARGEVYWYDHDVGRFVTSTYYAHRYPAWLDALQDTIALGLRADTVWRSTVPPAARALSEPDTSAYEADGVHSYFPHRFSAEGAGTSPRDFQAWLAFTPFIDGAVLRVAERAIAEDSLGADDVPDYLDIGLSQTDYIGHRYGPLSREQLDNLLRMDRELDRFFQVLDARVGKGNWVVALAADHGVLTKPEVRAAQALPGRRITGDWARQLYDAAAQAKADGPAIGARERAARAVERFPYIADAITYDELRGGAPADSFVTLYRRAFHEGRAADRFGLLGLMIRPAPGDLLTTSATGTSHGSPYWYDRWIPIAFLGDDIPAARIAHHIAAVDVAPTLAALAGVPVPKDLDGHSVLDLLHRGGP